MPIGCVPSKSSVMSVVMRARGCCENRVDAESKRICRLRVAIDTWGPIFQT